MTQVLTFKPITMAQLAANLRRYADEHDIEIPDLEYLGLEIHANRLVAFTSFYDDKGQTIAEGTQEVLSKLHDILMTPTSYEPLPSDSSNAAPKRSLSPQQMVKRERGLRRAQRHHAKKVSRNA